MNPQFDYSDENHFFADEVAASFLLKDFPIEGRDILEIGVGFGSLTRAILKRNPRSVVGYEIVKGRCTLSDSRFTLYERNVLYQGEDFSPYAGYSLISIPPYHVLHFIKNILFDKIGVTNYWLMTSEKYINIFPNHKLIGMLTGSVFTPPAKGNHYIITNGDK